MEKARAMFLALLLPTLLLAQSKSRTTPSAGAGNEAKPKPQVSFEGPYLEFDFPSVQIGVAEYEEGPTGVTVFYFPKGAVAAVDVRGGAPGTTNTDWLQLGFDFPTLDAVCFAGGSWYGLEAASGVRAELLATTQPDPLKEVANVAGAIVYDFPGRTNSVHPDRELGRAALRSVRPNRFLLGARGAGRFVHVGKYPDGNHKERAGQGGAFREIGPTKVAVFTVVNALGAIVGRDGKVARGFRDPQSGVRLSGDEILRRMTERATKPAPAPGESKTPPSNTTLTIVITNQKLGHWQLRRLAMQVHSSMGRAIQPFQTQRDGDVLFAVTTAETENKNL